MSREPRLPARVQFVEAVRPRFGPDRGFLFDERSGRVYSLNGSGAFAAARIQERQPTEQVLAAMVETYDVDATTARRALAVFVEQLVQEGIAEVLNG